MKKKSKFYLNQHFLKSFDPYLEEHILTSISKKKIPGHNLGKIYILTKALNLENTLA